MNGASIPSINSRENTLTSSPTPLPPFFFFLCCAFTYHVDHKPTRQRPLYDCEDGYEGLTSDAVSAGRYFHDHRILHCAHLLLHYSWLVHMLGEIGSASTDADRVSVRSRHGLLNRRFSPVLLVL